jgi:hypothetical protein
MILYVVIGILIGVSNSLFASENIFAESRVLSKKELFEKSVKLEKNMKNRKYNLRLFCEFKGLSFLETLLRDPEYKKFMEEADLLGEEVSKGNLSSSKSMSDLFSLDKKESSVRKFHSTPEFSSKVTFPFH